MKGIVVILLCGATLMSCCRTGDKTPAYFDSSRSVEERVEDALSRMTLKEKVAILHAQSRFSSAGVPRLGIPELWCTDGPHGIRPEVLWDSWNQAGWTNDSCTAYPALTCLAASFDRELAALYGRSIGEEARYREKDVLLGPGVNIYRTPLCGRNFEYMGEDPFLAGKLAAEYVKGVQEKGVAACVKHFALNNQEYDRHGYNAVVDERTLYELYLPAFKTALMEGGAWSVMAAYNKYKGMYLCENPILLQRILKEEWGYDGAVVSDWGGAHNTIPSQENGLDLEFGTKTDGLSSASGCTYDNFHLANPYLERLESGEASMEHLDDQVRRVLRLIMRTAMGKKGSWGALNSPEHIAAARKIGAEGMVLLKNDSGVLPLDPETVGKVVVVGENAVKMMTVGGGSSSLKVVHEVVPLEGIVSVLGEEKVCYERGYVGDISGSYNGVVTGQDLSEDRTPGQLISDAVAAARAADAVIFVGGLNKSKGQDAEGRDRNSYGLPYGQDALIEALAAANPRLAVVLVSGNAVAMPWISKVPAVLQAWFCGSETGNSLADVIFGRVNPSGKLPFSFPVSLEDSPAHMKEGRYVKEVNADVNYSEGIYVGYRWFDMFPERVLFPFGHGLSYTQFSYGEVKIDRSTIREGGKVRVSIPVTNVGNVAGKEAVQLYVGDDKCSVDRPVKELKGFEKLYLEPGQTGTAAFTLSSDDFKFFDPATHSWVLESGDFTIYLASSSADVRSTVKIRAK